MKEPSEGSVQEQRVLFDVKAMDVEPEEAIARHEESHPSRSLSGSIMMWPYEEHQPLRIRQRHLELLFEPG